VITPPAAAEHRSGAPRGRPGCLRRYSPSSSPRRPAAAAEVALLGRARRAAFTALRRACELGRGRRQRRRCRLRSMRMGRPGRAAYGGRSPHPPLAGPTLRRLWRRAGGRRAGAIRPGRVALRAAADRRISGCPAHGACRVPPWKASLGGPGRPAVFHTRGIMKPASVLGWPSRAVGPGLTIWRFDSAPTRWLTSRLGHAVTAASWPAAVMQSTAEFSRSDARCNNMSCDSDLG
jgi:hypothetical protein